MSDEVFFNMFLLFAGLFGSYSLNRLHPMRLYSLDMFFGDYKKSAVALRFLVGCIANCIVAMAFILAYYWFKNLSDAVLGVGKFAEIAVFSIVISASSLALVSHRIVAAIAIYFKQQLFLQDQKMYEECENSFKEFLTTKSHRHLFGAIAFFLLQMSLGFFAYMFYTIYFFYF